MTAQVFIVLAQAKGALLIPAAAIGNAVERTATNIQVLKADGTHERRALTLVHKRRSIKIVIQSEISAEVTEGLKEKEQVVIREITAPGTKKSPLTVRKGA